MGHHATCSGRQQNAAITTPTIADAGTHLAPFTIKDFARAASLAPQTVRRHIRAGKIHALKFGHDWRIPHAEFLKVMSGGFR